LEYRSILFETGEDTSEELPKTCALYSDLNLDRVIRDVTAGYRDYNLEPLYRKTLNSEAAIQYRQAVFKDLEDDNLFEQLKVFTQNMADVRKYLSLAGKLDCKYNREGWFLHAVDTYCRAVSEFADHLTGVTLKSRGLLLFRNFLLIYIDSSDYKFLKEEARQVKEELAKVKYCLHIKGNRITVRKYEGETDYSTEVEKAFAKFKQGEVTDYLFRFSQDAGMNHLEAQIAAYVAKIYPETFRRLAKFCEDNAGFQEDKIVAFDREVQFYLAYLDYIAGMKQSGLNFCYPQLTSENKEISSRDGFDLALADKLLSDNSSVVCNDFYLTGEERIIVVTGPNQGGKTTFARTFGQLHYLAGLGCPVPGTEAQLFIFDRIYTHFEREENIQDLQGKLENDLVRIKEILSEATSQSIIILNEVFNSTTLQDETFLSEKVVEEIIELDLIGVIVTFVDELASKNNKIVSMAGVMEQSDFSAITFKFARKSPQGLAHAISVAEKHGLTYEQVKEKISNEGSFTI